jgi:hypothetical protein
MGIRLVISLRSRPTCLLMHGSAWPLSVNLPEAHSLPHCQSHPPRGSGSSALLHTARCHLLRCSRDASAYVQRPPAPDVTHVALGQQLKRKFTAAKSPYHSIAPSQYVSPRHCPLSSPMHNGDVLALHVVHHDLADLCVQSAIPQKLYRSRVSILAPAFRC